MANTKVTTGVNDNFVHLSSMDSDYDEGRQRRLHSIQFNPGAAADQLIVRGDSATGAIIFNVTADGASDETIKYFPGSKVQPYIDYSECTLSSGAEVMIIYVEESM